ncbi:hypothetical protein EVAR_28102_1 [Eumeta japonica]|uniref:Uncharacterized protein n=1 Tax=Eumeta variegata TaxID=151549 RepID=A0A4C1WB30_EUMVA|nr:hypothetical protein EVAR_28102_1 [Eumeta japonica]
MGGSDRLLYAVSHVCSFRHHQKYKPTPVGVRVSSRRRHRATPPVQCNARNSATLNWLRMIYCAGITLPDPSFFPPRSYFTPLRRFRDELHNGKVSCVVLYAPALAISRQPRTNRVALAGSALPGMVA